ncbi:family 20 glycosylhydrolase [Algoriphagus sediminis]|uniref:beta-N-acetylhexosaminidase n=1 Tax=Algoriphagus sediminis TaxID=3057113 RepID=A0ABT7YB04_9BACT|nr:family 20 glycosylhydrolase [Algoriphagus sediminis]MDN3203706.1 family 20 glycosylhydrolase [Algoriphagus sediminis]
MKSYLIPILLLILFSSCGSQPEESLTEKSIIPLPREVSNGSGSFQINQSSSIKIEGSGEGIDWIASFLADEIGKASGSTPAVSDGGTIILQRTSGTNYEAYSIDISEESIILSSDGEPGLFYAVQTLLQTLPPEIASNGQLELPVEIPAGKIIDEPEYGYRGSMLDVARHFFSVEDVKHYIDIMARLKYNFFHLHLSDDQGWRIEIKSWPKLTEIGGSTEVGGGEGGFYTQEEYREIVNYAAQRYITVVPEIDMPGHTNAALASYAELNPGVNLANGVLDSLTKLPLDYDMPLVNPQPAELYTGIEVGFSTFATDLPLTYQFVDDVVREIVELTPGPYFHIGGDESHVTEKGDYINFVERAQEIVAKYGKISIGWDEVATTTLRPENIAQYWGDDENALLAVEQGNKVLMSPAKKTYMDMQYDSTTYLGLHWAAYIEVDDAYNWDPANYLEGIEKENILGVETPLWSETITNREEIEYMIFPRIYATAEVAWTPSSMRNFNNFSERLASASKRWDVRGINYYKSPRVNW